MNKCPTGFVTCHKFLINRIDLGLVTWDRIIYNYPRFLSPVTRYKLKNRTTINDPDLSERASAKKSKQYSQIVADKDLELNLQFHIVYGAIWIRVT